MSRELERTCGWAAVQAFYHARERKKTGLMGLHATGLVVYWAGLLGLACLGLISWPGLGLLGPVLGQTSRPASELGLTCCWALKNGH